MTLGEVSECRTRAAESEASGHDHTAYRQHVAERRVLGELHRVEKQQSVVSVLLCVVETWRLVAIVAQHDGRRPNATAVVANGRHDLLVDPIAPAILGPSPEESQLDKVQCPPGMFDTCRSVKASARSSRLSSNCLSSTRFTSSNHSSASIHSTQSEEAASTEAFLAAEKSSHHETCKTRAPYDSAARIVPSDEPVSTTTTSSTWSATDAMARPTVLSASRTIMMRDVDGMSDRTRPLACRLIGTDRRTRSEPWSSETR